MNWQLQSRQPHLATGGIRCRCLVTPLVLLFTFEPMAPDGSVGRKRTFLISATGHNPGTDIRAVLMTIFFEGSAHESTEPHMNVVGNAVIQQFQAQRSLHF